MVEKREEVRRPARRRIEPAEFDFGAAVEPVFFKFLFDGGFAGRPYDETAIRQDFYLLAMAAQQKTLGLWKEVKTHIVFIDARDRLEKAMEANGLDEKRRGEIFDHIDTEVAAILKDSHMQVKSAVNQGLAGPDPLAFGV